MQPRSLAPHTPVPPTPAHTPRTPLVVHQLLHKKLVHMNDLFDRVLEEALILSSVDAATEQAVRLTLDHKLDMFRRVVAETRRELRVHVMPSFMRSTKTRAGPMPEPTPAPRPAPRLRPTPLPRVATLSPRSPRSPRTPTPSTPKSPRTPRTPRSASPIPARPVRPVRPTPPSMAPPTYKRKVRIVSPKSGAVRTPRDSPVQMTDQRSDSE